MTREQEITLERLRAALGRAGCMEPSLPLPNLQGIEMGAGIAMLGGWSEDDPGAALLDLTQLCVNGLESLRARLEIGSDGEAALAGISAHAPRLVLSGALRLGGLVAEFVVTLDEFVASACLAVRSDGTIAVRSAELTVSHEGSRLELAADGWSRAKSQMANTLLNLQPVKRRMEEEANRRLAELIATGRLLAAWHSITSCAGALMPPAAVAHSPRMASDGSVLAARRAGT